MKEIVVRVDNYYSYVGWDGHGGCCEGVNKRWEAGWKMKEDTEQLIILGGGCFFMFLWRKTVPTDRILQLIELGVNADGRIRDVEPASWRADLSFGIAEPSACSTNFGDKAVLPSCIMEANG
jgi:hypothetical protein